MQPHAPTLTLPPARLQISGLDAALVGGTDVSVLRFSGSPATIGTAITQATTAANGTIVTISERGVYGAQLIGFCAASADGTAYGISKNGSGTALTATPANGLTGMLMAGEMLPDGNLFALQLFCTFTVSGAEAAAGCRIRFHATDDGGTPPGEVEPTSVLAIVYRLADFEG